MSYFVLPPGRTTLMLPPRAEICRFFGATVKIRVTSPPPDWTFTSAEVSDSASTSPPIAVTWRLPVRPMAVRLPPPVSTWVGPLTLPIGTSPPIAVTWRLPDSPLPDRSPPPVFSTSVPARSLAVTFPPWAHRLMLLLNPDAEMLAPLLHKVTAVRAGTARLALIPQSPLPTASQFTPMVAPPAVVFSLILGRTRPYWTIPLSRAVLPGPWRRATLPALMFTATWPF